MKRNLGSGKEELVFNDYGPNRSFTVKLSF
jgi:hypothetical protein